MNQILDKKIVFQNKINVEFSDEIFDVPYNEVQKKFISRKDRNNLNYKVQFIIFSFIAILSCFILLLNILKASHREKISQNLLNNYNLTTLYANSNSMYGTLDSNLPFIIGTIKIDKINLNYPIWSQANEELLKISVCRFSGPMPNEYGNLSIVGHNYIDNRFFGKINNLVNGDIIDIYDLSGEYVRYEIYNKYEVNYDDLSCTKASDLSNRIITLITCNNISTSKRLVVQAKEK